LAPADVHAILLRSASTTDPPVAAHRFAVSTPDDADVALAALLPCRARRHVVTLLRRFAENYTDRTQPDCPPKPWAIAAGWDDDAEFGKHGWIVGQGRLFEVNPGDFVRHHATAAHAERTEPVRPDPGTFTHVAHDQDRERRAIDRWAADSAHMAQLLRSAGLFDATARGWWCAVNVQRRDTFGGDCDGDVDLLLGPLEFNLDAEAWELRVHDEQQRLGSAAHSSHAWNLARIRAVCDGHLRWPPRTDRLLAVEVKASWFDPERGIWRRTHLGEDRRTAGQLEYLTSMCAANQLMRS
jgi:hypothetical protein